MGRAGRPPRGYRGGRSGAQKRPAIADGQNATVECRVKLDEKASRSAHARGRPGRSWCRPGRVRGQRQAPAHPGHGGAAGRPARCLRAAHGAGRADSREVAARSPATASPRHLPRNSSSGWPMGSHGKTKSDSLRAGPCPCLLRTPAVGLRLVLDLVLVADRSRRSSPGRYRRDLARGPRRRRRADDPHCALSAAAHRRKQVARPGGDRVLPGLCRRVRRGKPRRRAGAARGCRGVPCPWRASLAVCAAHSR